MITFFLRRCISDNAFANQLKTPSGFRGRIINRFMNSVNKKMNVAAVTALQLQPNHKVIDVGFGGGIALDYMTQKVNNGMVVGLEMSKISLTQARHKYRNLIKKGRIKLVNGANVQMPFYDNQFDRVNSINTVYFLNALLDNFKEIYRILKPSGMAVIGFRPPEEMKKLSFTKKGFKLYGKKTIILYLKSVGFKEIQIMEMNDGHLGYVCVTATKNTKWN